MEKDKIIQIMLFPGERGESPYTYGLSESGELYYLDETVGYEWMHLLTSPNK